MLNSKHYRFYRIYFFCSVFIFSFQLTLTAQTYLPFQFRELNLPLQNYLQTDTNGYFRNYCINYKDLQKINDSLFPRKLSRYYLIRKLRKESFVQVSQKEFYLTLDPIFNFQGGINTEDSLNEKIYTNARGLLVKGNISDNFSFESTFIENQSTFPAYIDNFADTFKVIPGQGRWKKFKANGYDYAASQGTISYAPHRILTIKAGHGKLFFGNGYRSLLLSTNAFNFPYALVHLHSKFISYALVYASLQQVDKVRKYTGGLSEPLFKKKSASFQYLTISPTKNFSISFFQATLFRVRDTVHPYFDWNVLNPIIFSSAAQYGLNRNPNVLLGADCNWKPFKNVNLFGQFVLDDYSTSTSDLRNKTGFQLGINYFNVLNLKNLVLHAEYNQVRPYTYAHSLPQQSYTHYGQALAHPLGANFKEAIVFLNYRWKDFFLQLKGNYSVYGKDTGIFHFGNDVFASDNFSIYGVNSTANYLLQGAKTTLTYQEFKVSYLLNAATNLNVFAQLTSRQESSTGFTRNTQLVYIGIATSIFYNYYDF